MCQRRYCVRIEGCTEDFDRTIVNFLFIFPFRIDDSNYKKHPYEESFRFPIFSAGEIFANSLSTYNLWT